MKPRTAIALVLVGAGATLLASVGLGGSLVETLKLAAVASGTACSVGIVGTVALYAVRNRSIAIQSVLVTLVPIGAVAAGAMAASHMMIGASHPVAALGVVVISAGTVGILISLALGARLRAGSERLIAATREIGGGNLRTTVGQPPAEEFSRLARELESMQSQLAGSRAREREAEAARRELVAWVSHDLRTPLSRIKAIVEALQDDVVTGPAEVSGYHARLSAEADRLGTLVNDLFELNRISAGAVELELERVKVGDIVSDLVASFAVIADARGVTLNAPPVNGELEVEVSPFHLERALGNLLDNALRYTHDGGVVDVELLTGPSEIRVTIDDGCGGMDLAELKLLLNGPSATQRLGRSGKTGLGLAIAKGLVEVQGGAIDVEEASRGCRFSVTLPLASATRTTTSARSTP
jgi:signal transduction histidine kinase